MIFDMLMTMITSKRIILSTILIIAIQLTACGASTPTPTVEIMTTTQPTITALPILAPSITPTNTELPATPLDTSTPASIPISSPPDGLRMAYVIDGNLYFQDGSKPPLQLTPPAPKKPPTISS